MDSPQIVPWVSLPDPEAAVTFYTEAFGATVVERLDNDAGGIEVAQLTVPDGDGAAPFWVQRDADAAPAAASPVRFILIVDDPHAVFARAVAAGATEVFPVQDGHGWRVGRIIDPTGLHWEIGKPLN